MESEPSQTLYINNINEKIKKDVLKKLFYMIFSQYGKVKQITACKGLKLRGQAWVVFHDVTAAIKAMKGKQGFIFYDKPLKIAFAKTNSKSVLKPGSGGNVASAETKPKNNKRPRDASDADNSAKDGLNHPATKEARTLVNNTTPHRILFAQELPADCGKQMLDMLFQQFAGFQEVRLAPGNKGVAFIEFENEIQSSMALRQLNGYQLTATASLNLTYSNN